MPDFLLERKILKSCNLVAGVDEAGRGAWAGPLVVAMVILNPKKFSSEIDDSKKLSPAKREFLAGNIKEQALGYAISIVDTDDIDALNVLQATLKGVRNCLEIIHPRPQHLLLDALRLSDLQVKQTSVIRGDELSYSIAGASILAKTTRDRIMREWGERDPRYGFEKHKGYGVRSHLMALERYGPLPIHRKSFRPIREIYERALFR